MADVVKQNIDELEELLFFQKIRSRRKRYILKHILEDVYLFVPLNESLPTSFSRKKIDDYVLLKKNAYQFESISNKRISIVGNDVWLEEGYKRKHCVSIQKTYILKSNDIINLLKLWWKTNLQGRCIVVNVIVINQPFDFGLEMPLYSEFISMAGIQHAVEYLSLKCYLTPYLDYIKTTIINRCNELYDKGNYMKKNTMNDNEYQQKLIKQGERITTSIQGLAKVVYSFDSIFIGRKDILIHTLHCYCMQCANDYIICDLLYYYDNRIKVFGSKLERLKGISLKELHVSSTFICDFTPAVDYFTEVNEQFLSDIDKILPLPLLQSWDHLLKMIRYCVNRSILEKHDYGGIDLRLTTLSTDDMIGIVTFIITHSYNCNYLPIYLVYTNAFSSFDFSSSPLGYAFGVIETAIMYIDSY